MFRMNERQIRYEHITFADFLENSLGNPWATGSALGILIDQYFLPSGIKYFEFILNLCFGVV